jgi:hypothetical protein
MCAKSKHVDISVANHCSTLQYEVKLFHVLFEMCVL